MVNPKVSVVIPTYNGSDYLSEAIESILNQTYTNFEVIVVDDASPIDPTNVVERFNDPRVKYHRHERNRGAVAARHTGVCASSGEIIAFLDQDDLFHRDKLQTHVSFLQAHPEIGATYNAKFEILDSSKTISGLSQPPRELGLADFVLGYRISPSDIVLKRDWALLDEIWDDSYATAAEHVIFNGWEILFGGRLVMGGCRFGNVGRALNYRRLHTQRILKHLASRCEAELACQEIVFRDSRCTQDVLALRNVAASNLYLTFASVAFNQEEPELGQEFLNNAVEVNPSLLTGEPCELVNSWFAWMARDISDFDHRYDAIISSIFDHLPQNLQKLEKERNGIIARGYLLKGIDTTIWGKIEEARAYLTRAEQLGAIIDSPTVQSIVSWLLDYETEFGAQASQGILRNLTANLEEVGIRQGSRILNGDYWISHAFSSYRDGDYNQVPRQVVNTITNYPNYLLNRGLWVILGRSIAGTWKKRMI